MPLVDRTSPVRNDECPADQLRAQSLADEGLDEFADITDPVTPDTLRRLEARLG
ncbi:hypothetical protein [Streptomyces hebeiensis]